MESHSALVAHGVALSALLAAAACGSARRGEPIAGQFVASEPAQSRGQIVFMQHCYKCHPGGEAGLGPSLNDKPLPKPVRKFQVRHALGVMPSFDQTRLSDKELEDLAAFLAVLRSR